MKKTVFLAICAAMLALFAFSSPISAAPADEDGTVFTVVDEMPVSPVTREEMAQLFRVNVQDVDPEADKAVVIVRVIVERDATVSKAEAFRKSGNDKLDAYAVKLVLDNIKQFKSPAMQRGKPVRSYFSFPVRFVK